MPFRFLLIPICFISWLGADIFFVQSNAPKGAFPFVQVRDLPSERISVRESTVDLQVSVGNSIFVFGKAKGTLDKVKVGMNVLHFSQNQVIETNQTTFNKVSWKKLKDGSIQIQSSYKPWPQVLTWTVYSDGRLRMEASSAPADYLNAGWLGLGFNYEGHQLLQVSWQGLSSESGHWKNQDGNPNSVQKKVKESEKQIFLQPIHSAQLEFEAISLQVKAESSGIFLGLGLAHNQVHSWPGLKSDLFFLFNQPHSDLSSSPLSPAAENQKETKVTLSPLVLWFHFQ